MSNQIKATNDYLLVTPNVGAEDVNEFGLVYQEDTSKNALRNGMVVGGDDNGYDAGMTVYYPGDKFYTVSKGGTQFHLVKKTDVVAIS